MTQPLTAMERRVYEYLLDFTAENTFQPSIREIGKRFRIKSTKTVSDILQALAAKGYIERDASRSRGVRLLGFSGTARTMPVPLYNRLHTGDSALVPEYREGFLTVDRRFVPGERTVFLRATGGGATGAGVFAGDLVMVNPDMQPREGDLVAAGSDGETIVRRFARDGETVVLRGDPADDAEIRLDGMVGWQLLGVVCGVFRTLFDQGTGPGDSIEAVLPT